MKELRCCVMIDTLYHKWLFLTSTSTHTYSLLEDDESLGVMPYACWSLESESELGLAPEV